MNCTCYFNERELAAGPQAQFVEHSDTCLIRVTARERRDLLDKALNTQEGYGEALTKMLLNEQEGKKNVLAKLKETSSKLAKILNVLKKSSCPDCDLYTSDPADNYCEEPLHIAAFALLQSMNKKK